MTAGEAYCAGKLVRVVADGRYGFVAGIIISRDTGRAIFAAPILRHYLGQHQDKLRQSFRRLGWRATIVRDFDPAPRCR
jgi:hypothetical protein